MDPHGAHPSSKPLLETLTARLRNMAHRLTTPRRDILDALRRGAHPMSHRQIHSALRGSCDLATVYRSVHLLESAGLVQRFDLGDGVRRYELLGEDGHGHHHHLVCRRCDRVVELLECFAPELEQRVASQSGYSGVTHRLEFFGTCPACQSA